MKYMPEPSFLYLIRDSITLTASVCYPSLLHIGLMITQASSRLAFTSKEMLLGLCIVYVNIILKYVRDMRNIVEHICFLKLIELYHWTRKNSYTCVGRWPKGTLFKRISHFRNNLISPSECFSYNLIAIILCLLVYVRGGQFLQTDILIWQEVQLSSSCPIWMHYPSNNNALIG